MRSLHHLARRHLTRRAGRSLLTAGGTALGVAVLFAVLVTTSGATDALDRALAGQAGAADVVVRGNGSYDSVLPSGTTDRVRGLDGVESVTPSLLLRSLLQPPGRDRSLDSRSEIVMVVATPLDAARQVKEFDLLRGRFPVPGAPELVVSSRLVDDLGLALGTTSDLTTPTGRHDARIVGVIDDVGAGLSHQGAVAYTSLAAGQSWDGRPGAVNTLDVVLAGGVQTDRWIAVHRDALGPSLAAVPAEDVAAGFAEFISSISAGLTLMSAIALFVGGFLVFLTFSLAVAERTQVYGTLRALGALPRQVRRVVVVEAAILGAVSSLVGLVLGFVLARAAIGLTGALLGLTMPAIGLPVGAAIVSAGVGIGLSVLAAWIPGRRAAAVSPLTAMRAGAEGIEAHGRPWPRVVLLLVTVALSFVPDLPLTARALVMLGVLLGAVLCVPFALRPVAALVGRATSRVGRGVGSIAVMHLVKERSRSAYTLGLVMVVLGMLLGVAGTNQATAALLDRMLDQQGSNIQVGAPGSFEPAVGAQLREIRGVAGVSPVRFGEVDVLLDDTRRGRQPLTVIEPESYFALSGFSIDRGDPDAARAALSRGGGLLLPTTVADQFGLSLGDPVQVQLGGAERATFSLAATYERVGQGFGVVLSQADAGQGRPNLFLVQPADTADTDAVVDRIDDALSSTYALVVDTPEGTRAYAFAQLQGFFSLAYVMLGLAAVIGLLGLANTLAVSVISRTREIGVLRSAGTLRRQVRAMVLVEAITLSSVAFVFAVPLGALLTADDFSPELEFVYPWSWLLPLAVVTLAVSAIASVLPARSAGRLEPVAALRFD